MKVIDENKREKIEIYKGNNKGREVRRTKKRKERDVKRT